MAEDETEVDVAESRSMESLRELLQCDHHECRAKEVSQVGGMGFPVRVVSCERCGKCRTIDRSPAIESVEDGDDGEETAEGLT